jgi:DNA-binding response OmpR family regulator
MPGYPQSCCFVLLVEDEPLIAVTLQDDLEEGGYEVAGPFTSCASAMAWLECDTPDLAVLDVELEDGSCKDLAAELSRRSVPFVVYSGYRQDRNTAPEFIGAPWVGKPASAETLLNALAGLQAGPMRQHG